MAGAAQLISGTSDLFWLQGPGLRSPVAGEKSVAKQRIVNTKFWDDSYILNLKPIEKLVFLYLLTNPLTNISGVYELPLERVAFDIGISREKVDVILKKFEGDRKSVLSNGWIGIVNFIKHQTLNPKVKQGILTELRRAPKEITDSLSIDYQRLCIADGVSGGLAEIILYDRSLSDAERKALRGYLARKYNLMAAPQAPAGVTVALLSGTETLVTWKVAPTGAELDYQVWRQEEAGPWSRISTVPTAGTYIDNGITAGKKYNYKVLAVNSGGASDFSLVASTMGAGAGNGGLPTDGMKLWLMGDGASTDSMGYWRDFSGDYSGTYNDAWKVSGTANKPTVVTDTLIGKQVIHFDGSKGQNLNLPNLMSGDSAGEIFGFIRSAAPGGHSNQVWHFGQYYGTYYPGGNGHLYDDFGNAGSGFPSYFAFDEGLPPVDITQLHVYEASQNQTGSFKTWLDGTLLLQTQAGVSFSDSSFLGGADSSYFYGDIAEVIVYNRTLSDSERQAVRGYFAAKYTTAAPNNLVVTAFSSTQIRLAWQSNGGAYFAIERKDGIGGTYSQIASITNGSTSYIDQPPDPLHQYYYRVATVIAGVPSVYSNAQTIQLPSAPTAAPQIASSTQVVLTWQGDNASTYIIQRKDGAGGSYIQIATLNGNLNSFVDHDLVAGTQYFYQVTAVNVSGSSSPSTAVSITPLVGMESMPSSGLKVWLKGDSGILPDAAGYISAWGDQSGNGNSASQAVQENGPILLTSAINGRPALHFDGKTSFLNLTNALQSASTGEMFLVTRSASYDASSNAGFMQIGAASGGAMYPSLGHIIDSFGSNAVYDTGLAPLDLTEWHLYNASSQAGSWINRFNSVVNFVSAGNSVGFAPSPTIGLSSGGQYFSGDIAELLIYDHVLTNSERRAVNHYLSSKYNKLLFETGIANSDDPSVPLLIQLTEPVGATPLP